jgi:hypothetical protein
LEKAYGEAATADKWAKVIGGLQSTLTHGYELARQTLLYEQSLQDEGVSGEGGQRQLLPNKKNNSPDTRGAKAETTKPALSAVEARREATRLRVAALRANKKSHTLGLTDRTKR